MVVTLSTLRQATFASVRALLIANKPTYTYNSGTITYTILAEYPRTTPVFPCIVINKGNPKDIRITLDASTGDQMIEVTLDFYAKELHGTKAIDAGQDSAMNTFIGNISTFIATDKLIPQEDFWTDIPSPPFQDNNQIINTGSSTVRFKLA